jgi:hypothetical protein
MSYSSAELQERAGITARQMDHWYHKGWLVSFDRRPGDGSGVPLEWSSRECDKATIMSNLIGAGFTPESAHDLAQRCLNRIIGSDDAYMITAGVGVWVRISLKEMRRS